MIILGIETSCDETAAAIVKDGTEILSNIVATSADLHKETGGIIPENAARKQIESIIPVLDKSLKTAFPQATTHNSLVAKIDSIAITAGGPGLIGSMLVGVETAKTLSFLWKKPIVPVVHLFAHVYANWLKKKPYPEFPAVVLTVAGGHTNLLLMKDHGKFEPLGGTRDDAAGEAFDKTARLLGLSYPGGPSIEKAALNADPRKINFPRPMIDSGDFDFSFSGLKTAVSVYTKKNKDQPTKDIAASLQEAIVDVLATKAVEAAKKHKARSLLIAGGVAANKRLREKLDELTNKIKKDAPTLYIPPPILCTDNATFIASYASFNYRPIHWHQISAIPDPYDAERYYKAL